MSTGPLPRRLDFRKAASREARVLGSLRAEDLPRLAPLLTGSDGTIAATASFFRDEERRFVVELSVDAALPVECQRCLGTVRQVVTTQSSLAAVSNDEQARQLPRRLDPLLAVEDEVDLWEMVEEELVLALPPFPCHDDPACIDALVPGGVDRGASVEEPVKDNPFEVLAQLTQDKDQGE